MSSFGVGGTNAHVVLEQAPEAPARRQSDHGPYIFPISAKSPRALARATENLERFCAAGDAAMGDIALTLQRGREAFAFRRAFVCADRKEAARALSSAPFAEGHVEAAPEVAMMFPGQGSQHVGMARELYARVPLFAEWIDRCADFLAPILGRDLRALLFHAGNEDDAEAALAQASLLQPALFAVEYALAKMWMACGVVPSAMMATPWASTLRPVSPECSRSRTR